MHEEIEKLFEEGVSYYENGKLDDAERKFLQALELDKTSEEIKYNLALVYLEKKEYDKTDYLISQITEIDCDEIIDELEKVEYETAESNPFEEKSEIQSTLINQTIKDYTDFLNDEYLPKRIVCEICDLELELSELERQDKFYKCKECGYENDIRKKEKELKEEFKNKPDAELFEMLIEASNFRLEFIFAAKNEIKNRNIQLIENEDFINILKKYF